MNLATIDSTIHALCAQIEQTDHDIPAWHQLPECLLLREACICVFSSQMLFEVAEAAADRINDERLLTHAESSPIRSAHERLLPHGTIDSPDGQSKRSAPPSSTPFPESDGAPLGRHCRDATRSAAIPARPPGASRSPRDARCRLVQIVSGFGPKQASLFLRRVGYSAQLAILDVHILDYLRAARQVKVNYSAISRLSGYEHIEDEFRRFASEVGQPVGRVDVATWVTVRVAKREALW